MGRRLLVLGILLAAAFGPGTSTGAAPVVDRQAWSRQSPLPAVDAEEGRIYVGMIAGMEDARAYIRLAFEPEEAEGLAAASLVLTETDGSFLADSAALKACVLAAAIPAEGEIETEAAPEADCTVRADLYREESTWYVPLGVFAASWAASDNYGLAVLAADEPPSPNFRVAFDTAATTVADVVPPPPPETTEPEPPAPPPPPSPPAEPGAGDVVIDEYLAGGGVDTSQPDSGEGAALDDPGTEAAEPTPAAVVTPVAGAPTPSALAVFGLLVPGAAAAFASRRVRRRVVVPPAVSRVVASPGMLGIAVLAVLALLPLLASEVVVYKSGLLLIFLVAAVGLHMLVNWAGELSLAHAQMVGLPAFVTLGLSAEQGISPVLLLPVAVVVGALAGTVVALPALRARGVQVVLVTLATGIAIDRFLFTKDWFIGPPGGRLAATPSLFGVDFRTSRSLYPVLVVVVGVVLVAAWVLLHSRVARSWFWTRADAAAASAFGISVVFHRVLAYTVAGAFAGVAGGLTTMWVQQLTANVFPTALSFEYLLVVVLSGAGYVGGIVAAVVAMQGPELFWSFGPVLIYLGAIALVFNITYYPAGLNGFGRSLMERIRARRQAQVVELAGAEPEVPTHRTVSLTLVAGCAFIALGLIAITLAWYHTGSTNSIWVQNQEILSGGIGGLALVLVGTALLIREQLARNHADLARQLAELVTSSPDHEQTAPRRARRASAR